MSQNPRPSVKAAAVAADSAAATLAANCCANQPQSSPAPEQIRQHEQQQRQRQQQRHLYDRIRVLGKGAFGTAIVHRRRTDCSLVVLKEIDLKRFKGEREKLSAINEARIMSTLSHANIIKYHNAYTTDTKLVIEMEYASIGTLAAYLSHQAQPMEELEILVIFRQITSGLSYLHSKNIVHLDLKMANIFVTIEGLVKIGDFSIAQYMNSSEELICKDPPNDNCPQMNDNELQQKKRQNGQQRSKRNSNNTAIAACAPATTMGAGSHLGTLAYSSPERCLGVATDYKSDIWSLGCILYELITSKPLFSADSLPELVLNITRIQYYPIKRNIAPGLRETFEQMIAREPSERPSAVKLLTTTNKLIVHHQVHRQRIGGGKMGGGVAGGPAAAAAAGTGFTTAASRRRFDLSTELALMAAHNEPDLSQINYPRSLVYQVRLDARHIHMDRVNLPQSKRIKEMVRGKSHYLVLTHDNLVYGWGSKSRGQLGACGLAQGAHSSSTKSSHKGGLHNRANSEPVASHLLSTLSAASSPATSLASSTQTILTTPNKPTPGSSARWPSSASGQQQQTHLSRQAVLSLLESSAPSSRPFVVNELNHRKIVQVAAGNNFSVFLNKTGIVMTCGDGSSGCLGRGDLRASYTPCMVESLLNSDVVRIGCGPRHVVAVCGNGRAFAWGKISHGRLGVQAAGRQVSPTFGQATTTTPTTFSTGPSQSMITDPSGRYVLTPQPVHLPEDVFIKNVFCADKSTVFIDSLNRCWACGENRSNKLGLDVRRRFKRTLLVDRSWLPRLIVPLSKYKIVTCSIGEHHSAFITSEGKLIVFGQDIDHTYRLRSNIICARDSHRRISFELQTKRRTNRLHLRQNNMPTNQLLPPNDAACEGDEEKEKYHSPRKITCKQLVESSLLNDQLANFKKSPPEFIDNLLGVDCRHEQDQLGNNGRNLYYRDHRRNNCHKLVVKNDAHYNLSRFQRKQVDSYLRKSRATKKMPFECVLSVRCTSKFTLALTDDNHVYFWGVRAYRQDEGSGSCSFLVPTRQGEKNLDQEQAQQQRDQMCRSCLAKRRAAIEPQLVAAYSDECFIKIGATNSSLMSSIQNLGSDQPIIHAQDPRLKAKSLADLWILDYQPTDDNDESTSTSSSFVESISSISRAQDLISTSRQSSSSSSSSLKSIGSQSLCSLCCSSTSCSGSSNSLADNGQEEKVNDGPEVRASEEELGDCMKYAAILEPQPIVSLYVPSMFNYSGCSLHLADLFCFDENRFYLILDTTIKLQQANRQSQQLQSWPQQMQQYQQVQGQRQQGHTTSPIGPLLSKQWAARLGASGAGGNDSQLTATNRVRLNTSLTELGKATGQQHQASRLRPVATTSGAVTNLGLNGMSRWQTDEITSRLANSPVELNPRTKGALQLQATHLAYRQCNGITTGSQLADALEDGIEMKEGEKLACDANNNSDNKNNNDINDASGQAQASSSLGGGESLDEPRSLSTFATSVGGGSHIIVGPSMRSLANMQQPLKPLNFTDADNHAQQSQVFDATDSTLCAGEAPGERLHSGSYLTAHRANSRTKKRIRYPTRSELTSGMNGNEADETSSMPSWVRNEFIQQRQDEQRCGDHDVDGRCSHTERLVLDDDNDHEFLHTVDGSYTTENTCMSGVSLTTASTSSTTSDNLTLANEQDLAHVAVIRGLSGSSSSSSSSLASTLASSRHSAPASCSSSSSSSSSPLSLSARSCRRSESPADYTSASIRTSGSSILEPLAGLGLPVQEVRDQDEVNGAQTISRSMLSSSEPNISQPAKCHQLEPLGGALDTLMERRASVVTGQSQASKRIADGAARLRPCEATNNLLDCNVYRNYGNARQVQEEGEEQGHVERPYPSSVNLNCGLSTRSSSQNPLSRLSTNELTSRLLEAAPNATQRASVIGDTTDSTAYHHLPSRMNLGDTSSYQHHGSFEAQRQRIEAIQVGPANVVGREKYRHHGSMQLNNTTTATSLSQSIQQLRSPAAAAKGRVGASSWSLTSSLRRSLVKLFC